LTRQSQSSKTKPSGTGREEREKAKEVILSVIEEDPRERGYRYPLWTVPK